MNNEQFRLIAAPFTPLDRDGRLHTAVIDDYAAHLVRNGISGVFICGTTGEAVSLTLGERMKVTEKWVEAAGGKMTVITHVGGNCLDECVRLASHAAETGADAVAAFAPCFFRPATAAELVDFFVPVAKAAGSLPFYYYHMPSMTGIAVAASDIVAEAGARIPNFRGVKFTHSDLFDMQKCLMSGNGIEVMHGYDEMLLAGLSLGAVSAVGSTYNYIPTVYHNVVSSFFRGDMAQAQVYQRRSVELVKILIKYGGGVRGGKAIMKIAGIDCGDCRLPLKPFSREEFAALEREIEAFGWLDRAECVLRNE